MNISKRWKISSYLLACLLACLLFFAFLQMPLYVTDDGSHDIGSQSVLEYWLTHGYAFGVDIVQNAGPLGFINYPNLYSGFLGYKKFLIVFGIYALEAVLAIAISLRIPILLIRYSFLSCICFFLYANYTDPGMYFLILLIAYALVIFARLRTMIPLVVVLAALSLAKGAFLFLSIFIISFTSLRYASNHQKQLALTAPLVYILSLIGIWVVCGQKLINLPSFWTASISFSSGYNEAMSLFENSQIFILGFLTLLLCVCGILLNRLTNWRKVKRRELISSLCLAVIELFILFVTWKHGFVRADAHVLIFFQFNACASITYIWLFAQPTRMNSRLLLIRSVLSLSIISIAISGILTITPLNEYLRTLANRYSTNPLHLINFKSYSNKLKLQLENSVKTMQMPLTNIETTGKEVSYFGIFPGAMVYNQFVYRPMPSTISFASWNQWIMDKDRAFVLNDATAPPYFLYSLQTIDNRLVAQDSAPAQLEIFQRYDPILYNAKDRILLKRRNGAKELVAKTIQTETQHKIDEWIVVPDSENVRLKINLAANLFASLLGTLYKPPAYQIEYILANGTSEIRKFMPRMAKEGFLVAPLIAGNGDFLAAHNRREYDAYRADPSRKLNNFRNRSINLSRISKFRISCVHLKFACSNTFTTIFETIEGLEFGRTDVKVPGFDVAEW